MWLYHGYMKKGGKDWGYLNEIEKIQVVPHFCNKHSSYMENYLRRRENAPSHIKKQQNPNKNVTKIEITQGNHFTSRFYNLV